MRTIIWRKFEAGVGLIFLLLMAAAAQAATFDKFDYWIPKPLNRWCSYSYLSPVGFTGFTIRISPITSGKYAGKYYWGDWNVPQNETDVWRIVSWDSTNFYLHASQLGGDFPSPVVIPRICSLDTIIPSPIPGDTHCPWYYTFRPNLTVPAGTFKDVLLDLVLDTDYPPNSMNTALELSLPHAVTYVGVFAKGIGEIWSADIDAASGAIRYSYQLQSTGISSAFPAMLPLLLGE